MKIAYIYDVIYPYVKGGAERRFWELAFRLAASGHEVHMFGMRSWQGEPCLTREGVHIHGIGRPRELYLKAGRRGIRPALSFSLQLLPALWRGHFDIIDCNAFPYLAFFPAKIFASLRRIPLVVTWQEVWGNYWYRYLGYTRGLCARLIEKAVILLSRHNIAHSFQTGTKLIELGMKEKNIRIIPHGIDFNLLKDTPAAAEESDLIFVGRLIKEKNADLLLRAAALLKEEIKGLRCILIGDGPEKEALVKLAGELGLEGNVVFKGFLEYERIIALMKSSRVFVFPSAREGFGIAVIEAMGCGLPVITLRHPMNAASELIQDNKNGFLCAADAAEISRKALYLLGNEASREEFSRAAEGSVQDYDWDRVVSSNAGFYNSLISKSRNS